MSCEDCRYWLMDDDVPSLGTCRRYPPTVLAGDNERVEEALDPWDVENLLHRSVNPVTGKGWTCGEFLAKGKAN